MEWPPESRNNNDRSPKYLGIQISNILSEDQRTRGRVFDTVVSADHKRRPSVHRKPKRKEFFREEFYYKFVNQMS